MRGMDHQQSHMFSYLSPEARVRKDHPLRAIRAMVDEVLRALSLQFDRMYAREGRPSIASEKLLRAQLLQMLYSIRSERLLMEEPRPADDASCRLPHQPKEAETDRGVFRLAQDDCSVAQATTSRIVQGGLAVHLCLRSL